MQVDLGNHGTSADRAEQGKCDISYADTPADVINEKCISCGRCTQGCTFLASYGSPGKLAAEVLSGYPWDFSPYNCNLCGLCVEICPEHLPVKQMFLELRRNYVSVGAIDLRRYKSLLAYESWGSSKFFRHYSIPSDCDTVFFPGCNLPGSRPEQTYWVYSALKEYDKRLGIVLDCCFKPSHDLGMQNKFERNFATIVERLREVGISKILVACPSCFWVFKEYGSPLEVESVYEVLAHHGQNDKLGSALYQVHDACATRYENNLQQAVRTLALQKGLTLIETDKNFSRAMCCGEGGGVYCSSPELAGRWVEHRVHEAGGLPILTYCGGCSEFLGRRVRATHILDLLYSPKKALVGKERVSRSPFTYLNRLRLKRRLQRKENNNSIAGRNIQYHKQTLGVSVVVFMLTTVFALLRILLSA